MKQYSDISASVAEDAVKFAEQRGITLDYTMDSVESVDGLLGAYHDNLERYDGDDGAKTLWNVAVVFGTYIGETLLRSGLAEKGFVWIVDDGMPIVIVDATQLFSFKERHCEHCLNKTINKGTPEEKTS